MAWNTTWEGQVGSELSWAASTIVQFGKNHPFYADYSERREKIDDVGEELVAKPLNVFVSPLSKNEDLDTSVDPRGCILEKMENVVQVTSVPLADKGEEEVRKSDLAPEVACRRACDKRRPRHHRKEHVEQLRGEVVYGVHHGSCKRWKERHGVPTSCLPWCDWYL